MYRILAIEDDALFGESLGDVLRDEGFAFERVASLESARRRLEACRYDAVLLDTYLPDGSGPDLIPEIRAGGHGRIVCLTASAQVPAVVEAMRAGAHDYVVKMGPPEALIARLRQSLVESGDGEARPRTQVPLERTLLGATEPMQVLRRLVRIAADSDSTVLLSGETGTGKSHAARLIHAHSSRQGRPFITVDCAALSETLAESQLFGHERGAFTGAVQRRIGALEAAGNGTLFFDELADLPPSVQGKLLRALEDRVYVRVGSNQELPVRARVIGATRFDLRALVAQGRFREDLYFRLSVLEVILPPLRTRQQDLPQLLDFFLAQLDEGAGSAPPQLVAALQRYRFPGNVRELRNLTERLSLMRRALGRAPTVEELGLTELRIPAALAPIERESDTRDDEADVDDACAAEPCPEQIGLALVASGGRIGEAAHALGMSRHALRRKLKRMQDDIDDSQVMRSVRAAGV